MEKLKPCPFCGGEAMYDETYGFGSVFCTKCGTERPTGFTGNDKKENAIKQWNTRATGWIKTSERLPDNANKPKAFCPRYQIITRYGITEGWFAPYEHKAGGRWYALIWFLREPYDSCNIDMYIDMIHGDIPKVVENIDVLAWMPLPELPEVEE